MSGSAVGDLILAIAPLTVLAAVSPVVFLNASTVATNGGAAAGARFAIGNLLVLVVLGTASVGILGAAAASFAARQIASRSVDAFLGVLLLGYGTYLAISYWRVHGSGRSAPEPDPSAADVVATAAERGGILAWGALGMMTNFTTLPLYLSVSQRVGAAPIGMVAKILVLGAATGVVLTPAWVPLVILRFAPDRARVSPHARALVARGTTVASILACAIGATFLLLHTF